MSETINKELFNGLEDKDKRFIQQAQICLVSYKMLNNFDFITNLVNNKIVNNELHNALALMMLLKQKNIINKEHIVNYNALLHTVIVEMEKSMRIKENEEDED